MAKTRSKKNTETSAHHEPSQQQIIQQEQAQENLEHAQRNPGQEPGGGTTGSAKMEPGQLVQMVATHLPTFEAIIQHLKENEKIQEGHVSPLRSRIEVSDSSEGSSDRHHRRKKTRRSPLRPYSYAEPSYRQSHVQTPCPTNPARENRGYPARENLDNTAQQHPYNPAPERQRNPAWGEPDNAAREELNRILNPEADLRRYTLTPFTPEVENYPLPTKFKIPTIKPYDATTDPEDHLFIFLTQMRLQAVPDAIRCWTLPPTEMK